MSDNNPTEEEFDVQLSDLFVELMAVVKRHVAAETLPLLKRIQQLEQRPVPKYLGVWKDGMYTEQSFVTHSGSVWVCLKDTDTKPGSGSRDWVLAVKGT